MGMDPQTVLCPNQACPARGRVGEGNIWIHSQKERRYLGTECGRTFSERKGTPFYRLPKSPELFVQVITRLAYGCPPQAIVKAFRLDERTVQHWQQQAGAQCQAVHEHLVVAPGRELGEVRKQRRKTRAKGEKVVHFRLPPFPFRLSEAGSSGWRWQGWCVVACGWGVWSASDATRR